MDQIPRHDQFAFILQTKIRCVTFVNTPELQRIKECLLFVFHSRYNSHNPLFPAPTVVSLTLARYQQD